MKYVKAILNIELMVECPKCENYFDIYYSSLNDEGDLHEAVMPNDIPWIDAHELFECDIKCPECKTEIKIKGVEW